MSILSWFSSLFAPATPPPFMYRPGKMPGSRVQLWWRPSNLPLNVFQDGRDWNARDVFEAVRWWNAAAGRKLFSLPSDFDPSLWAAFEDPKKRQFLKGCILVRTDNLDADHGSSDFVYDDKTGEIGNVIVTLPGVSHRPYDVARHEMGHVLGLAHSPDETTLMGPRLPPAGVALPLAEYQLRAVKAMVG